MPVHKIGDKTNLDKGDLFISLKAKGESLTFRLAQSDYTYDAKHFSKRADGKWDIAECPRIMQEIECHTCEQYFEYAKQIKALKISKAKGSTDQIKALEEEARKYKPKTTFYYAILNRTAKQAQVLQVSLMIRLKLEEYHENGFKVVDSDFIYTRTEKPGNDYYSFLRKDSADTEELDADEVKEMDKARNLKLEELTVSKKGTHDFEEAPPPDEE